MYKIILQYKKILLPCLLIFGCFVLFNYLDTSVAFADGLTDNTEIFNFGDDQNVGTAGSLSKQLYDIASGLSYAGHMILIIMTVVSGCMVAFGLEDGKKTMWSYILGITLAIHFAEVLLDSGMFGGQLKPLGTATTGDSSVMEKIVTVRADGTSDPLSDFMTYYNGLIVTNGRAFLVPIAFKLTIILASIDASIKLAMDMISGDKIKFLISTTLKIGFYLFLIDNWIAIAGAWSLFCQYIGFHAGGAANVGANLKADSIWQNGLQMFNAIVTGAGKGTSGASGISTFLNAISGGLIITIVCAIVMIICICLTAIEMFMARVEFYTMVLVGIIMLPFGVCDKTEFLTKQAISAVFNLGGKVMIIAFIQAIATSLLTKYSENFIKALTSGGPGAHFPLMLQMCLLCAVIMIITKKVPDLVSGFLNGSPSLSGSSMKDMMVSAAKTAGNAATHGAGFVAGAAKGTMAEGIAKGETGGGLLMSSLGRTAMNMGRAGVLAAAAQNPITTGFTAGVQKALAADGLVASQADPKNPGKHSFRNAFKVQNGGLDSSGAMTGNDAYSLLKGEKKHPVAQEEPKTEGQQVRANHAYQPSASASDAPSTPPGSDPKSSSKDDSKSSKAGNPARKDDDTFNPK